MTSPVPLASSELEPPQCLRGSLAERVRQVESGDLDVSRWRNEADQWSEVADGRYRACTELRRFRGNQPPIRIGVKDTADVVGFATRLGLRRYRHYPAQTAAPLRSLPPRLVTAKLVAAELGLGLEHGCVNPFFPHLDPAGSSTGCAVAVAANISDAAMGTDTVVSLRHPAAACGVVGLRLTHDVRLLDGIFPLSPLLDAPGWITRTADDLAFVWKRLRLGGGGARVASADELPIGVVREAIEEVEERAVRDALDSVCELLADAGRALVPVGLDDLWRRRSSAYELCARTAWDAHQRWGIGLDETLSESTQRALAIGAAIGERRRDELRRDITIFQRAAPQRFARDGVAAWLLPVADFMPRNLHEEEPPPSTLRNGRDLDDSRTVSYATIASIAGLPAITFPTAVDESRRAPVALQLIGPPGAEADLIRLAQTVERLVGDLGFSLDRYAATGGLR